MVIILPKYRNVHRPPHLYLDNTTYFVTTRTFNKVKYFTGNERKKLWYVVLQRSLEKYSAKLYAWVILNNHYHLLFFLKNGTDLPKLFQNLHTNSSRLVNELDSRPGTKIWHQYQDHGIRNEADFWRHFNYIHHNPVKHGYANNMAAYRFSSYNNWLKKEGADWLESCFRYYPILDYSK